MKTSAETKQIERYLLGRMQPASKLLFEARLLIDPILRTKVRCQSNVYSIIRRSARRQLKAEAERIHRELFHDPSKRDFQSHIKQIFSGQ